MSIAQGISVRVVDYISASAAVGLYFLKKIGGEFWAALS